jgi:polysaccharide deacetylase 2 family uncharacterized protein YibQ
VSDDVHEPLGLDPQVSRGPRRRPGKGALALICVVAGSLAILALVYRETPNGGEPYAVAKLEAATPARLPVPPQQAVADSDDATGAIASGSQVEAASGVKVVRTFGASAPNALIIDVPKALGVQLVPAPDKRLVEKSRYGLLPKLGADGARPFDVYARPIFTSSRLPASAPRIALMVGGLGINESGTESAIATLPGAVTLGFAPYGATVNRQAAEARANGHETLLQAPMESFSYPADNPGPHTLVVAASDAENLDSLHWLMSRFSGFVGVANYLGGKLTADSRAMSPILSDLAARGLGYFDDGTSPRSVARETAASFSIPSARADAVIDGNPSPQAIDDALARLEALARLRGSAIGVATASPIVVERLGVWAAGLEAKGIVLTPVSALMVRSPSPSAQAKP